jgi:hypothetical protein
VSKEFLKRWYTYQGPARIALLEEYKKICKQQMGMFTRLAKINMSSLTASYEVALELAMSKKPVSD